MTTTVEQEGNDGWCRANPFHFHPNSTSENNREWPIGEYPHIPTHIGLPYRRAVAFLILVNEYHSLFSVSLGTCFFRSLTMMVPPAVEKLMHLDRSFAMYDTWYFTCSSHGWFPTLRQICTRMEVNRETISESLLAGRPNWGIIDGYVPNDLSLLNHGLSADRSYYRNTMTIERSADLALILSAVGGQIDAFAHLLRNATLFLGPKAVKIIFQSHFTRFTNISMLNCTPLLLNEVVNFLSCHDPRLLARRWEGGMMTSPRAVMERLLPFSFFSFLGQWHDLHLDAVRKTDESTSTRVEVEQDGFFPAFAEMLFRSFILLPPEVGGRGRYLSGKRKLEPDSCDIELFSDPSTNQVVLKAYILAALSFLFRKKHGANDVHTSFACISTAILNYYSREIPEGLRHYSAQDLEGWETILAALNDKDSLVGPGELMTVLMAAYAKWLNGPISWRSIRAEGRLRELGLLLDTPALGGLCGGDERIASAGILMLEVIHHRIKKSKEGRKWEGSLISWIVPHWLDFPNRAPFTPLTAVDEMVLTSVFKLAGAEVHQWKFATRTMDDIRKEDPAFDYDLWVLTTQTSRLLHRIAMHSMSESFQDSYLEVLKTSESLHGSAPPLLGCIFCEFNQKDDREEYGSFEEVPSEFKAFFEFERVREEQQGELLTSVWDEENQEFNSFCYCSVIYCLMRQESLKVLNWAGERGLLKRSLAAIFSCFNPSPVCKGPVFKLSHLDVAYLNPKISPEVVQCLVHHGENPDQCKTKVAFTYAEQHHHLVRSIVQKRFDFAMAIIKGSVSGSHIRKNLESVDQFGRSPLMVAAARGHIDVVRALLEAGVDPDSGRNKFGVS